MVKKPSKLIFFATIAIALTSLLALHKTLGFYFWHDDFSVLYGARTGECVFGWPYLAYCSMFTFLDKFFNYSPFLYFLLGFLLAVVVAISFFHLARQIFSDETSFFLATMFATSFVGAGAFLESYSSITSFLSLGALFISIAFLLQAVKEGDLKIKEAIVAFIFFCLSVASLRARATTYAIPLGAAIFLFSKKKKLANKLLLSFLVVGFHLFVYLVVPLGKSGVSASSSLAKYSWLFGVNILDKLYYFFQNIGSFILFDMFEAGLNRRVGLDMRENIYLSLGVLMVFAFFLYCFSERKKVRVTKMRTFAVIFTLAMYLPYGMLSDWRLGSNHRYLIFVLPPVLLVWGSFYERRWWRFASVLIVLLGVVQSNLLFGKHLAVSKKRAQFYKQLHEIMPVVEENSVLFFDFPDDIKVQADDFFRVGHDPSEASLGTEYRVDYKKLTLITDRETLEKKLKENKIAPDRFYSFRYDGEVVTISR